MSIKGIGAGTTLEMDDGAGNYTPIAEIRSIGELTRERPEVDATSLSSLAREYVPGMATAPEFDIELNMMLDNATQDHISGIAYVFNNSLTRSFRIRPSGETKYIQFSGFFKSHTYGPFELEAIKAVKGRIKITGAVTIN